MEAKESYFFTCRRRNAFVWGLLISKSPEYCKYIFYTYKKKEKEKEEEKKKKEEKKEEEKKEEEKKMMEWREKMIE